MQRDALFELEPEFTRPESDIILSIQKWATNGDLIADCARLGYLRTEWRTLDCTYGHGTFWSVWRPSDLTCTDLDPAKSFAASVDFTNMPWSDRSFDAVVFDPPYKLNGTPDPAEERYGVHKATRWQDRMELIRLGVIECARVLGDGYLLVKCQDQVVSGKKRWQTDEITRWAQGCGLGKVDRFDFEGYRPQPEGRGQEHTQQASSQLLVFKRGVWTSHQPRGGEGSVTE